MFVERIIYCDNDEFVWEMNLSGLKENPREYHVGNIPKENLKDLKSDDNFKIIYRLVITMNECRDYMKNILHRRFFPKSWRDITVKIAVK